MALIGKIRQNMWFVFALLGVALVAFMMMDSSPGGGGGASGANAISVDGNKIDINTLQRIESLESNATGFSGNALRNKVYEDYITRSLVANEGEALGLGVSEEELEQLLFGNKLSPVIQQMPMFIDQRTRTISSEALQNVKMTGESEEGFNPGFQAMWDEKIKHVKSAEVQNKISTLVSKGIYTPTWMAEQLAETNSITAGIEYVKVPFTAIADSDVSLSDSDYNNYMSDNKSRFFQKEEGRVVEYAVFAIEATREDSLTLKQGLASKIEDFKNKGNGADSSFALANGGNYLDFYFPKEDLPEAYQTFVSDIEVGDVYGPIVNDRFYSAMKLIDRQVVADSVKVSHIFRPTVPTDLAGISSAVNYIDSLKNLIERGSASYDSLAIKYSQDPSSASNGGDLGYITQGQFFPAINKVAFFSGNIGQLYTVKTQNGVHLIKVTDRIFTTQDPKFKVAFINAPIEPSLKTIGDITNEASEFISDNRDLTAMRAAISKYPNASIKTSKVLTKQDFQFQEFGFNDDARAIVLWAFNEETDAGDASPDMFSFRDKQFNYENAIVVPGLQAKTSKGMSSLSDVKGSIEAEVMQYAKGTKLSSMVNGKSMTDAAGMTGATMGTIDAVRTGSSFVGEIGYEPKVMAAILATDQGATSAPIVGESGVYIIKVNSKSAPATGNAAFAKQSENVKARQNTNFNLFEAMRKGAKVKDKRMDFGI